MLFSTNIVARAQTKARLAAYEEEVASLSQKLKTLQDENAQVKAQNQAILRIFSDASTAVQHTLISQNCLSDQVVDSTLAPTVSPVEQTDDTTDYVAAVEPDFTRLAPLQGNLPNVDAFSFNEDAPDTLFDNTNMFNAPALAEDSFHSQKLYRDVFSKHDDHDTILGNPVCSSSSQIAAAMSEMFQGMLREWSAIVLALGEEKN